MNAPSQRAVRSCASWTAIAVILFAPRADQAYDTVVRFTIGNIFAALFAAIVLFALLPGVSTFVGFSLVMGLYLIPVGALAAQSWQTAIFTPMAANFVPLVAPANVMSYDTAKFSNGALAIIAGTTCAAISFRLLPPPSPAFRTHRLLALSLRDLRRLAAGARWQKRDDWEDRIYGRVEALPDTAEPLQRARLVAALAAGAEILRLRRLMHRLELSWGIDEPLRALALGDPVLATACLARIDADLAIIDSNAERYGPLTLNRDGSRSRYIFNPSGNAIELLWLRLIREQRVAPGLAPLPRPGASPFRRRQSSNDVN